MCSSSQSTRKPLVDIGFSDSWPPAITPTDGSTSSDAVLRCPAPVRASPREWARRSLRGVQKQQVRWNLNIHYHRVVLGAVPTEAANALDVGCGNGLLSFDLAAQGLDVIGVDPDAPSIERASTDADASGRTVFLCADVFTHRFEPASFDVVASNAMLHHVDAERGLRRMRELVRPGGVLAIVGFATPSGPIDLALIAAGFVYETFQRLRGRYWEHDAPKQWPPPLSINEMRALVERELPGARFRRAMAHRYSVVWQAR